MSGPLPQTDSGLKEDQQISISRKQGNSIAFFICTALAMITATGLTLLSVFVVPNFAKVFAAFGASVPLATSLVLRLHPLFWLAVPAALACLLTGLFVARRAMTYLLIVLGVGNLLLGAGCIVILYLPIFSLSQIH